MRKTDIQLCMKQSASLTVELLQRSMIRGNEESQKHKINLYCPFTPSKIPRKKYQ